MLCPLESFPMQPMSFKDTVATLAHRQTVLDSSGLGLKPLLTTRLI